MLSNKQNSSFPIVPTISISLLDIIYTASKITQIFMDTAELYLTIVDILKTKSEPAARLTIKTILMSLQKKDYITFFRYVDMFSDLLKQIEENKNMTEDNLKLCRVAFGFLLQIKILVNSTNKEDYFKIVDYGFYTLDNGDNMFFLFFTKDTNEPIIDYSIIENKEEFKNMVKNIVTECANDVLKKYF
ncbi:MAG: hypothetical protein LBG48_00285 [Rickettsiales bacterium]|jgi:hypothetical protein|nr:hypothetical protein [Rickettsiales bacterium]